MNDHQKLRDEFIRLLTTDVGKDKRRREYNQAIFNPHNGRPDWDNVHISMILEKFDKACRNIESN